jgi:hypothetical protein
VLYNESDLVYEAGVAAWWAGHRSAAAEPDDGGGGGGMEFEPEAHEFAE